MDALPIPESFQDRPYARRHFARIAAWARAHHPFYQAMARTPDEPFPVLTRADVQERNALLLNGHPSSGRTSGSTSTAVEIAWSPERVRLDQRDTARYVKWLGGLMPAMRIVSLSAHEAKDNVIDVNTPIPEQVEFMQRQNRLNGACALSTYPTNLEMLCRYVIENGIDMRFLRRCVALSEVYEPYHDELVRQAFPNAVATCTYSAVEVGLIAARCPHRPDNYHIMAHKLGVEFLNDEGRPCRDGELGQVVVTDYFNRYSTLIRYALGDLAAPIRCECGRIELPAMTNIVGKVRGVLKDGQGRPVIFTALSPALRDSPEIRQFQVVQTAIGRFTVRVVPWADADRATFESRTCGLFQAQFGPETELAFEYHDQLARTAGGKFLAAICQV